MKLTKSFQIRENDWEKIRELAFIKRLTCSEIIRRSISDYLEKNNG